MKSFSARVPIKGYEIIYVEAETKAEALKKIDEGDYDREQDDIDWDLGQGYSRIKIEDLLKEEP